MPDVFEKLKGEGKKMAQKLTGDETKQAQRDGTMDFGEVLRASQKKEKEVMDEVFSLVDLSIGEYLVEASAEELQRMPELIDATANGEDMRKQWLTPETEEKLKELKPKFLMEFQEHGLKDWLSERLALSFRRRILVEVCIQAMMAAVGLAVVEKHAQKDWENARRKIKGLRELEENENMSDASDDELLNETDQERWERKEPKGAYNSIVRLANKQQPDSNLGAAGEMAEGAGILDGEASAAAEGGMTDDEKIAALTAKLQAAADQLD